MTKRIKSKKEEKISMKNYIYSVLILVVLLTLYVFKWYQVKKEERLLKGYLVASNTVTNITNSLDTLNQIRQEAPSSYFIYLSYTESEDIYNFEKELKRVIDKYKLNDSFYYVDLTELKRNNDNYLEEIKKSLEIDNLDNIPAIIYVYEGVILERNILDGVNNTSLKIDDLKQLLDVYEFEAVK